MLKKPIWSATETTLFYYSGDSTTGQVWFEWMGCKRCCFLPSWLYWPCTIYQLISKDGHYPCAMLQYISPTSHWMRSPGANFRAGFYPCHKYILYQSTLFTNSPYWSALDFWKIKLDEFDFLSISNLNFEGYTGSKNQVRNRQKIKFIQLDFSNLIFQKSSADQ